MGFKILEFSIGMGPKILKKEHNGILYSLRALPIGGMCNFYGEDDEIKDPRSFNAHKPWKRILVILAGPAMNILFAFICAIIALSIFGDIVPQVVDYSYADSPAQIAGIQPGDMLYAVNGEKITFYSEAATMIQAVEGEEMDLTVERDGERIVLHLADCYNEEAGHNVIGISYMSVRKHYSFFGAIEASASFVGAVLKEMFSFLGSIFTQGVQRGEVAGPVGTINYMGMAVRAGWETVLRIAVLISINLGIINLLPLPALDGGRLVFLIVEWIRGKPVPPRREGMVHFVGIVLLFGLMIFLTYNDIATLITGG